MAKANPWEFVEDIVALNGGVLVGRTRLQKSIYLLQEMLLAEGYDFDYYHFGPYSDALAEDVRFAEFFGELESEPLPGAHSVPYTKFKTTAKLPKFMDENKAKSIKDALCKLQHHEALLLELAATWRFLETHGYPETAKEEVTIRKPNKATPDRLTRAKKLLVELGLKKG